MVRKALALVCIAALSTASVLARDGGHPSGSHPSGSHPSGSHPSSSAPNRDPREHYGRIYLSYRGPGDHHMNVYPTQRGTTVTGHYSTNANGHFGDNYSTKGNVNAQTGKEGTKTSPPNGEPR